MKKILYILIFVCAFTSGCSLTPKPPVVPKIIPYDERLKSEPLVGNIERADVDMVMREYIDENGELQREQVKFPVHGIQKGAAHTMVPLVEESTSGLSALGISVSIDYRGRSARLLYEEYYLDFDTESLTCFRNNEPVALLVDIPYYNNGTLYVPLEPVLEAFDIVYQIEENKLIVK